MIDALTGKSRELELQMQDASADYMKLQELSEEKEKTDEELDAKIERFLELQELLESLQNDNMKD